MTLVFGKSYSAQAIWGPRAETPEDLAIRYGKLIDALRDISPLLQTWVFGAKTFDAMRPRLAQFIASKVMKDDFGKPDPIFGSLFGHYTKGQPESLSYSLNVCVGATYPERFLNHVIFQTESGTIPAPEAITYEIFKPALLAVVEAWAPELCFAYPTELLKQIERTSYFRENWMLYLSPRLVPFVTPPQTSINEYLADGGLLMSATTETFRIDNPHHMAVARDIKAAVAHLRLG
jgi:hypothetical protein